MLNQKPISARIQHQTLWEMELETQATGMSRNRILNEGARLYLNLLDTRRAYRSIPYPDDRKKILNGFLKLWFPEAATW
ncbi:MAG: hypothetical protein J6Q95_04545 [Alistipes sp.]|nr:hypothetical protein [Alistipes sp.]